MSEVPELKIVSSDELIVAAHPDLSDPQIILRASSGHASEDREVYIPLDRVERVISYLRSTAAALEQAIKNSPESIAIARHSE